MSILVFCPEFVRFFYFERQSIFFGLAERIIQLSWTFLSWVCQFLSFFVYINSLHHFISKLHISYDKETTNILSISCWGGRDFELVSGFSACTSDLVSLWWSATLFTHPRGNYCAAVKYSASHRRTLDRTRNFTRFFVNAMMSGRPSLARNLWFHGEKCKESFY